VSRSGLMNPFEIIRQQPQIVDRSATRFVRSTPVCVTCKSDDIISIATAQWSNEAQEWQLASTFDRPAHCNTCNSSCSLEWLMLN